MHRQRFALRAARSAPCPDVLAAVDLGSNSFHMVVARYPRPDWSSLTGCARWCAWRAGIEENGRIDKDVAARALACLERFGQRLRDMHADSVRVVGTNALRRRAPQAGVSRARARGAGTSHRNRLRHGGGAPDLLGRGAHVPNEPGRRLVCDIGGGSTELIIGEGAEPLELESLQMGCVSLSERFFRRRQPVRQAHRTGAARRAPGARADPGGVPATRLGPP